MRTYRLVLSIGGVVLVDADRHEAREGMIFFYREDSVIAEYASATVTEMSETTPTQKVGIFAPLKSRERGQGQPGSAGGAETGG